MRTVYYPKNEDLKKYIQYISYFELDDTHTELLVFPNAGAAIGLNKDNKFEKIADNSYKAVRTPGNHSVLLHNNRIDPVKISDDGQREVITIVFRPFGVNHFIQHNLVDLIEANNGDPSFISLVGFSFSGFANSVFEMQSMEDRIPRIEDFLLRKLTPIDIPAVTEAVALLADMDHEHTIPAICKMIGTSQRNLTRLFSKHICLTPVQFRNVVQFRYSLRKKFEAGETLNMKDIGYESNYTHSSYMIRMYKKYTGLNPSAFFDKVAIEGNYVFLAL